MFKEDMISDGIEIAFNTFIPNPQKSQILLLTLRKSFIMRFSAESKEKVVEIKNKILEKSGYDQVFYDDGVDGMNSATIMHQRCCSQ